jgi:hypothetical protein
MAAKLDDDSLQALKIAFSYMPNAMDVNSFEYGDRVDTVLAHIDAVREILLHNDVDPDEVFDEINEDIAPNSSY